MDKMPIVKGPRFETILRSFNKSLGGGWMDDYDYERDEIEFECLVGDNETIKYVGYVTNIGLTEWWVINAKDPTITVECVVHVFGEKWPKHKVRLVGYNALKMERALEEEKDPNVPPNQKPKKVVPTGYMQIEKRHVKPKKANPKPKGEKTQRKQKRQKRPQKRR